MSNENESWHLDKKIPIVLIFAILVQSSAAIWWAARTDSRIESQEKRVEKIELSVISSNDSVSANTTALAVFNAHIINLKEQLNRMETTLNGLEKENK